ncbi:MAG: 50S ribosomal protein L18e [Nanoarchaeota archaeon]|nr:50S ribosomal protein L18e [Nanoarchaeota archaeon]
MNIRDKNPLLKGLITELVTTRCEEVAPIYTAVAKLLNKPRRVRHEVTLYHLSKFAKDKEIIIVPGTVLGTGEVTKAIPVAAIKFSKRAQEKITKAGGTCMSIEDVFKNHPDGKGVRILG